MTATETTSTRFGDYELLRYLAAGGMADLYLARHPRYPGRELVVKRIQDRYLDHTRVVKMFIDEGNIAKLLAHPNIVRVLDVGKHDGAYYIAMEYIHGHDLVAVGRRSVEAAMRIPRAVAVGVVAQAAAGLDYAHNRRDERGQPLRIVHCDVSPGNVVIAFRGSTKIVDFGIARATIALREEEHVAGKYNYMSPEQIRGEPVDERADLFSLGVILYELSLGRRLFRGRPEQVMRKVLYDAPPHPEEVEAGYPPFLAQIVMRLLERDREQRYPNAAMLASDLNSYLEREEGGYSKADIARYLRTLFDAPVHEGLEDTTGPAALVDDVELDRGMPETGETERAEPSDVYDEDSEYSDAHRLPFDGSSVGEDGFAGVSDPAHEDQDEEPFAEEARLELLPGPSPSDEAFDLPSSMPEGDEESSESRESSTIGPPQPRDLDDLDGLPPRRSGISPSIVVGSCMMILAVVLVIAYFTAGR